MEFVIEVILTTLFSFQTQEHFISSAQINVAFQAFNLRTQAETGANKNILILVNWQKK